MQHCWTQYYCSFGHAITGANQPALIAHARRPLTPSSLPKCRNLAAKNEISLFFTRKRVSQVGFLVPLGKVGLLLHSDQAACECLRYTELERPRTIFGARLTELESQSSSQKVSSSFLRQKFRSRLDPASTGRARHYRSRFN